MIVKVYRGSGVWGYSRYKLEDGSVVLAHRYEMELFLGRKLTSDEHVHHKDGDKSNNTIDNLELMTNSDHAKEHAVPAKVVELVCPACETYFTRSERYVRMKLKGGQKNFLCSRTCRMPRTKRKGSGGSNPLISTFISR